MERLNRKLMGRMDPAHDKLIVFGQLIHTKNENALLLSRVEHGVLIVVIFRVIEVTAVVEVTVGLVGGDLLVYPFLQQVATIIMVHSGRHGSNTNYTPTTNRL